MELQLYFILCKRVEIEYIDYRVIVAKKKNNLKNLTILEKA